MQLELELIPFKAISYVSEYNKTYISLLLRLLINSNVRNYLGLILFSDASYLQDSTEGSWIYSYRFQF